VLLYELLLTEKMGYCLNLSPDTMHITGAKHTRCSQRRLLLHLPLFTASSLLLAQMSRSVMLRRAASHSSIM